MQDYLSRSGKESGVTAFEIGKDYIIVRFNTRSYKYSYASCGKKATETMKSLARASEGLSTYISQDDPVYEWKK